MQGELQTEWMQQTTLHPLAVVILIFTAGVVLLGKRHHAVLGFLLVACCVSGAQNINFAGMSLYLLRMLIACGLVRCLCRGEFSATRWSAIDALVIAWSISGTIIYVIQRGDPSAIIFKLGMAVDSAGGYFVFRGLLREREDAVRAIRSLALIAVPVAGFFALERATRINLFSTFGGVPLITVIRDGRLRCQGAFAHPILAGAFWAACLPTFVALIISGKGRLLGFAGGLACLIIIGACASSTPVLAVLAGLAGLALFVVRRQMRLVQLVTVATLCGLHLVMKGPVWHLLARSDVVGGSTGYYRYILVDAAIRHFSDWWLIGLASTEHWGKEYNHYLTDITNHYILEGLRGGAITFILFIAINGFAFAAIGREFRERAMKDDPWLTWSLGVALFVHCTSFIAVSYFGQIVLLYHLHLAMIASLAGSCQSAPASRRVARVVSFSCRTPSAAM